MNGVNNTTLIGNKGRNVVIETAGRLYVRTGGKYYEIDFRNQNRQSSSAKKTIETTEEVVETPDYVTKEYLDGELANYITKRTWADVKETQKALEEAQLEGFTESINPITIDTMQVIVGSNQLQFDFVNSLTDSTVVEHHPWINSNGNLICTDGYIKHYTLKGPSAVQPDTSVNDYYRWHVYNTDNSGLTTLYVTDINKAYYLYIVAEKPTDEDKTLEEKANMADDPVAKTGVYAKTGNAYFLVSETSYALENDIDPNNYYLLYAIINSGDSEGRSVSTMNGFTEILPGQITAYIFKSPQGDSYIDLKGNRYKFGDNFSYNADGDGALKIKGAILQNDGGEVAYAVCPRGNYAINTIYYCGDTVQYTNSEGVSGTYLYKKATSGSSTDPDWPINDTDTWQLYVTGSQGKAGTTSRIRIWKSNGSIKYYAGDEEINGIYWLDFVYDNSVQKYYKCIKTHTPATGATNPAKDTTNWVLENSFSFIATSVLFAGDGGEGWIIDEGKIAHTGGNATFTKDGAIALGQPSVYAWLCINKYHATTYSGDTLYTLKDYESMFNSGEIAEGDSVECYSDIDCTRALSGFVVGSIYEGRGTIVYEYSDYTESYEHFSELEEYPTYINSQGQLYINNAVIRGNLDSVTLNIGDGNFRVDEDGYMTAKDATFSGDVTIEDSHTLVANSSDEEFFKVTPGTIEFEKTVDSIPFGNITRYWHGSLMSKETHTDSAVLFSRAISEAGSIITIPKISITRKLKHASVEYVVLLREYNGSTIVGNLHAWYTTGFPFIDWKSGNSYTKGQYIRYNSTLYSCISTVSSSTTVPSSDTTHFKILASTETVDTINSFTIGTSETDYTLTLGRTVLLEIIIYGELQAQILSQSYAVTSVTASSVTVTYPSQHNRFLFGSNGIQFYFSGYQFKFNPTDSSGVGVMEMSCTKQNKTCGIKIVNNGNSPQVLLHLGSGWKQIIADENGYLHL